MAPINKEKKVLLKVLDMFKDMEYLWNKEHEDYNKKHVKQKGYQVLLETYKTFDDTATLKTFKKKLDNMRTFYMRELRKVNSFKHAADGSEDEYVPSLWYFDALSFLGSTPESYHPTEVYLKNEDSSLLEEDIEITESTVQESSPATIRKKRTFLQDSPLPEEDYEMIESPVQDPASIKTKKSILELKVNLLDAAEKPQSVEEWDVLGRSIGIQMRDLKRRESAIAQKLISDVLFYAKIGRLTEDSYVCCGNPSSPSSSYPFFSHDQKRDPL